MASEKLEYNPWQRVALDTYDGGEFNQIETQEDLEDCGDTLFEFLMIELSDTEDCDSFPEAIRRVRRAAEELLAVEAALCDEYNKGRKHA